MNGSQLAHFLSLDKITSKYFKGLVMRNSDDFPMKNEDPSLYIMNTDDEVGKGEHWCVAFFSEGVCDFFDSFGQAPTVYGFGKLLAKKNIHKITYNPLCVQDISSKMCGHHCLFFSFYRCRGMNMTEIVNKYDPQNMSHNDKMVLKFATNFGRWYNPIM